MLQKAVIWPVHQIISLPIWLVCASTTINSKTKKSTADGNSLRNLICGNIHLISLETLTQKINLIMNSKVLFYIMELLILDIISLTLKKVKINGLSSMMRESENMIPETLNPIVSVVKIGEDNLKVHISLFTKKSRRDPSLLSLKPNKKKNQHWLNSVWEKLSFKTKLNLKRKSNFWRNKQSKKNLNQKFKKNLKKHKNQKFSLIWIPLKFLPSFLRISDKKYQKQMKSFHFRLTYRMMNSRTFCTRFCRFNHLMNLQQSIWNCVTNVSI